MKRHDYEIGMIGLGVINDLTGRLQPGDLIIDAGNSYFGAHTYERADAKGTFHTEWEGSQTHEAK